MWLFKKRKKRIKRASSVTKHYQAHKEIARKLTQTRLLHFNQHYKLTWKRVAIRNQRRRWGSCSSLKNLNFNYKIIFLPPHLQDYIIVHELCHLKHLNHGKLFWDLVGEKIPNYQSNLVELRQIDKHANSISSLIKIQENYHLFAPDSEDKCEFYCKNDALNK